MSKSFERLLLWAFFFSGMTALLYEVVWTRPLQLIFGSTIYAVSAMLTTFFAGFAIGSYAFRNVADETENPGRLFGKLQIGIGLYGLLILYLFSILPSVYLSFAASSGLQFVQFALIFLVLIIPTVMFGATWPVVNKAYDSLGDLGEDTGRLYAFNSFGSFLGPILGGFFLIPLLGIMKSSILVAVMNLVIGFVVISYSKRRENES